MKFLILLSILCIFSQDIVEVTGREIFYCPNCRRQAQCYADPCMSYPCGAPNKVCKACYCMGCDSYTCNERPLKE
ncbi:unnamed protein product [Porites evermanni]|uniref:Uncharacterized protein n=1 Tax=Porites evermanni TaxID=104178 RepID=A0ABN8LWY5_9CNID|nr:unnamed protein product [Porites evermanni]